LTLTLENTPTVNDSAQTVALSRVAWQVLDVDDPNRPFTVQIPSYIGFGTVEILEGDDEAVNSPHFLCGPPGSLVTLIYQGGLRWLPSTCLPDGNALKAANASGVPRKIALGSYYSTEGSHEGSFFRPFLVTGKIPNKHILCAEPQLVLQGYKTQGLRSGQILTESILLASERLFDADGVNVMNLRPSIHCRLKPRSAGGMSMEIER